MVTLAAWREGPAQVRLVAFSGLVDSVRLSFATEPRWSLGGAFADVEEALKPDGLVAKLGLPRALHVHIDKALPATPGLGCAPALMAAILRATARIQGDAPPPPDIDTAACLRGRLSLIGAPPRKDAPSVGALHAVLIDPAETDALPDAPRADAPEQDTLETAGALIEWLYESRPDLPSSLAEARDELDLTPGCLGAVVPPGSAIAVGFYPDAATALGAARHLGALHREWWVEATTLS